MIQLGIKRNAKNVFSFCHAKVSFWCVSFEFIVLLMTILGWDSAMGIFDSAGSKVQSITEPGHFKMCELLLYQHGGNGE